MNDFVYRIWGTAVFPEGIAPGEGKGTSNILSVSRNGNNELVLRGSSLAGALRAALCNETDAGVSDLWFGRGLDKGMEQSSDSLIIVPDMILKTAGVVNEPEKRTHNMINRHTGSVVQNGLFSLESILPGSQGTIILYIKGIDGAEKDKTLQDALKFVLGGSLTLGGNRNRGIGRLLCQNMKICKLNLTDKNQFAEWMNARYADQASAPQSIKGDVPFDIAVSENELVLDLKLRIPRGEDFVIGYGTTLNNYQSEPQYVVKADGKRYWRIPGSSFRGVFRSWMSRLAAKNHGTLRDSTCWNKLQDMTGDNIGWGFVPNKEEREKYQNRPSDINDPIMNLFGSLYKRGRIHFSDAYSTAPVKEADTQIRRHVAIDRFSGGANDGMLFTNKVLVGDVNFTMQVSVAAPETQELEWLKQTLAAINLGVISFGSSKGSGLLEISNLDDLNRKISGVAVCAK